jgi:hypothetical protein
MQWRLAQPLKQPWRGQSKTGSMQIFVVQELAPPSSLDAGGEPRLKPPSGRLIGGRENPPDELLPEDELALPPSSLSDASSEGAVASSSTELEPESSSLRPPPLVLPVPVLPLPDPLPLEAHDAPVQPPDELLLLPLLTLPNPPLPVESLPLAQPATRAPRRAPAAA